MTAILVLDDGYLFQASNMAFSGAIYFAAEQIPPEHAQLKRWVSDLSVRCAPFFDFDTRGLSDRNRALFWDAIDKAYQDLVSRFGPDVHEQENAFSASCLFRLMQRYTAFGSHVGKSRETGEEWRPFDGRMIDLDFLFMSPDD